MKIDESFKKIMERNHITKEQLSNMISNTIELAKKDLNRGLKIYNSIENGT